MKDIIEMQKNKNEKCWICGKTAKTREHRTKKSDIKSIVGSISQKNPIYFSDDRRKNIPVGGLNNEQLKFSSHICAYCNNSRTQPYDKSWEAFSTKLRKKNSNGFKSSSFRANSIFEHEVKKNMTNVHLYFAKLFGCLIQDGNIPIPIQHFSEAILNNQVHPNLYLKFFIRDTTGHTHKPHLFGGSDLEIIQKNNEIILAHWFYELDNLIVEPIYSTEEISDNSPYHWHPKFGCKRIPISGSLQI